MDNTEDEKKGGSVSETKPSVTLPGTVEKIIESEYTAEPEKAEISVEGADHLYKEIRIENTLQDDQGKEVKLKEGAEVQVTIEAEANATEAKSESDRPEKSGGGNQR